MWNRELLREKKFWAAAGAAALLLALLSAWGVRSYQRSQARDALNEYAPFQNPPLEVTFPRLAVEKESPPAVLQPGLRNGIWTLQARSGRPPFWEVRLTDKGQRWFSVVGNQVVAAFKAGTRQVTRVVGLEGPFPSRRVRFRYVWTELHPGSVVLGAHTPGIGKEYEGEAVFFYERDVWRIRHWSTPDFDEAVVHFKSLESAQP